jgi:hypothetical protein
MSIISVFLDAIRRWFWAQDSGEPGLIVDVELIGDLLYLRFYNPTSYEAKDVSVYFSEVLRGFRGQKEISAMNLFQNLSYMPPGKEFKILLDEVESFFQYFLKDILHIRIEYTNYKGRKVVRKFKHNLTIYHDMIILKNNTI